MKPLSYPTLSRFFTTFHSDGRPFAFFWEVTPEDLVFRHEKDEHGCIQSIFLERFSLASVLRLCTLGCKTEITPEATAETYPWARDVVFPPKPTMRLCAEHTVVFNRIETLFCLEDRITHAPIGKARRLAFFSLS
jgi:hypothetical protein